MGKLTYYPFSLLLRWRIAAARRLLAGPYRWHILERLGVPGHGVDLLRLDFPPGAPGALWGQDGQPLHPELAAVLGRDAPAQQDLLERCLAHAAAVRAWPPSEDPARPDQPWTDNLFLTLLDEAALYGLLRHFRPRRYLEIGSGMSTRVAWHARRDGNFPMEIISIDPEPRFEISGLCDRTVRRRLEEVAGEIPALLTPDTLFFFDGSHRSFPGSDVTVFFLELLPRMPAGTLVHIHDIYLPADYPRRLLSRYWSEQYLLGAHLLGGGQGLEILLPCAHLLRRPESRPLIERALGPAGLRGSSFWLRKR
ncbi:MAG TPA: class I SAM-dependent methyltransferase [Opitutaceae bacterium]|nr:class I SAM-dependent methyltransferase [Opitutaceae bacterium]